MSAFGCVSFFMLVTQLSSTRHMPQGGTHTQSWTRAGERARDYTQSVLCQITNKYHAWPKAAIKAINWQRATPGRCQCDDKQSMAHIVEDPDAHTLVLAKTHSIYCCDNVPGIAVAVARVAAAVVALVTTVAVAVAINV